MAGLDIDAEREKIKWEIEELQRSLGLEGLPSIDVSMSDTSLESGSNDEDDMEDDDDDDSNTQVDMEGEPRVWNGDSEEDVGSDLPQTPDTCLQMNLVYQEVIQEKIEEINLLLAQNKEHQEKLNGELSGTKGAKSEDGKALPANMFLGHFLKPYFKDKTSGVGPPANSDAREKALQGIKSFEELITVKWKSREKQLLHQSVASDCLQRLLQPKLMKLDYLNGKQGKAKDGVERQILDKQIQETEREISEINMLPEGALLGNRFDKHDWEKIANINFEGTRNAKELRKFWQNAEHPSINKREWSEEEVRQLKEAAARHNCLDWEAIAQELGTQRTAFQCLQVFQAHNKDFKRSEWSPEEDRMLLQLVQEMRVGDHIPYRKIAYYMEGRDSAQLIYRWTKRVNPKLKRGAWTPEEDALLLKAVAKYGERDWYKIRTEVPGRNDLQCRERYWNSLHFDIKKGKWGEEEERKLVELTEKYGTGCWAKIASELPHRSGSQCLSKWKVLLGYRKAKARNRAKKPGRKRRASSRPEEEEEESSSEDSELELEGSSAEEEPEEPQAQPAKAASQWSVPSIDLWVPTRKDPAQPRPRELPSAPVLLLSKGFDENRRRKPAPGGTALDSMAGQPAVGRLAGESRPSLQAPVGVEVAAETASEKAASTKPRNRKDSWRVSLAYVKSVLRRETYELQKRSRELHRRRRFDPGWTWVRAAPGETPRGPVAGQWKMTLYRRLMLAVTPWAGDAVQALAQRAQEQAARTSKAELISKLLQAARLTSTPLFTLLIQLLHIDVAGCMKVIQKRKCRQPDLLRALVGSDSSGSAGRAEQASPAQSAKGLPILQSILQSSKKFIPLKVKEGPGAAPPHPWQALLAPRPAQKPKTVSELLREKRLREAEARRAAQKSLLLAPRLLLPPALVIPQPAGLAGPMHPQTWPLSSAGPAQPAPGGGGGSGQAAPKEDTATARRERDNSPASSQSEESLQTRAANGAPRLLLPARAQLPPQVPGAGAPRLLDPGSALPPSVLGLRDSGQHPGSLAAPQGPSQLGSKPLLPVTWVLPLAVVSVPPPAKQLGGTPGSSPEQGLAVEAPLGKAAAVNLAPLAAGWGQPQASLPSPGALPSSLQKEGGPQPASRSLSPAAPSELPSQLPPACSPSGPSAASMGATSSTPPHGGCPPREEKVSPDYRLVCREEEAAAVQKWAKAEAGAVWAPPLGAAAGLPHLPPFLSSLRTLSALLLNKEALERSAASLVVPPPEQQEEEEQEEEEEPGGRPNLQALRALVWRHLRENPAYQLLRARFLATFSFPAALATLPPFRVMTTLSGGRGGQGCQEGDSCLSEEEEEEEKEEEAGRRHCELGRAGGSEPRKPAGVEEEPGAERASLGELGAAGIRRSTRLRKRRRTWL